MLTVVFVVGAPGTNGSLGAIYTLVLNRMGNLISTTSLSYATNDQLRHYRFGSSLNAVQFSDSIVLIVGAPGPEVNFSTNNNSNSSTALLGAVYLIVYSYSYRLLGVRALSYDMIVSILRNTKPEFVSSVLLSFVTQSFSV